MTHQPINAILFDLDGTLIDSAHPLLHSINLALKEHQRPLITYESLRQHISGGADAMVKHAFDIDEAHHQFADFKQQCLNHYANNITTNMCYFPGIEAVLDYLDAIHMPWGIVTNKSTRFTEPTLAAMGLADRAHVVVAADTLPYMKPHPAPLLHACEQLQQAPQHTLYVGDYETDVVASRAAGMPCMIVTYGYYPDHMQPHEWQADYTVDHADELLAYLKNSKENHS